MMRPKRPKRHVTARRRMERVEAMGLNKGSSMDFMSDELYNGQRIRLLTLVDNFTRESLAIEVDTQFGVHRVVEVLKLVGLERSLPKTIRVDNGPEFISKVLDQWDYLNKIELDFSRPGKPTDNAFIEAFNDRLREECLNENWFLSLEDAREKIDMWKEEYNRQRPRGALGNLSPEEFIMAGELVSK